MKNSSFGSVLLMSFSPLVGMLTLLHQKYNFGKLLGFLFFFFIVGYSLNYDIDTHDSFRYSNTFVLTCSSNSLEFDIESIWEFWTVLISYVVSRFTHNVHVFWGINGSIFGLFVYLTFSNINKLISRKWSYVVILVTIGMYCLNPHVNINGFRFWTAAWAFLAGWTGCALLNSYKYSICFLFSVLLHITFILPIFVLLCCLILPKWTGRRFGLLLLLISSIFYIIGDGVSIVERLPNIDYLNHYLAYLDVDYILEVNEKQNEISWIHKLSNYISIIILDFVSIKLLFIDNIYANSKIPLLSVVFFIASFYFIGVLPSVGRFVTVANMMFMTIFVDMFNREIKLHKINMIFATIIVLLFVFPAFYSYLLLHKDLFDTSSFLLPIFF